MSKKYAVFSNGDADSAQHAGLLYHHWDLNSSKVYFENTQLDGENIIYIYELKEVHRRKKGSNGDVGVKEVWI